MNFIWHPFAAVQLAPAALAVAAAAIVYLNRPQAIQNRLLALALFVEGIIFLTVWLTWSVTDPGDAYAARIINQSLAWGWPLSYLLFLGTLDSPLSRPFSTRIARTVILAAWLLGSASVVLFPQWYITGMQRTPIGTYDLVPAPGNLAITIVFQAVFLFGLIVAFTSWKRTPIGSVRRSRAAAYLAAFGIRDFLLLVSIAFFYAGFLAHYTGLLVIVAMQVAAVSIFVPVLAYGMLKTQLFDIDLKIKWTIKKSTLVAIFVGVFFVSAQVAQAFLTTEYGWAVGGIVAGLLLLAINPLQRLAGRVADAAMPNVHDTDDYRTVRKQEVYKAALGEMLADGAVTTKERRVLFRLQRDLGLDPAAASAIEERVVEAMEEN